MSTQTRQYKQLTLGQRYQIQALHGKGHLQKEIAETVGISCTYCLNPTLSAWFSLSNKNLPIRLWY